MKPFVLFVFKNYLAPILVLLAVVLPFSLKRYPISEKEINIAYQSDISGYNWVNKVDPVTGFIFGSSTLRYGLSSNLLRKNDSLWINFSMDARDPVEYYELLKAYYPLKKPRTVLMGLDPWIYSKGYYKYRSKIMYLDLEPEETMKYTPKDKSVIFTKFRQWWSIKLMHAKLSKVNVPPFPVPDDYGSVKLNAKAVNFNQMDDDWFDVSKFGWSDIQFESLKRIKEYCHMHNIRLIFLIPAKRKDFSNLATTKFKNENTYWWHRINEIAGGEYVIGNYRCLDACNQDSIFAEAFHLNMEGQKYFSKYVKDRLDSPGVISEHYSFD